MSGRRDTIKTRNVTPGKAGLRADRARIEAMSRAILAAVPRREPGLAFRDLPDQVARRVPKALFRGASIGWYATVAKLDLEAGARIRRIKGSRPQRLLRVR